MEYLEQIEIALFALVYISFLASVYTFGRAWRFGREIKEHLRKEHGVKTPLQSAFTNAEIRTYVKDPLEADFIAEKNFKVFKRFVVSLGFTVFFVLVLLVV